MRRVAWLSLICGLLSVSYAFAECGPRPERACELVNNEGPIIIATVLGPADPNSVRLVNWRVRVDRSFRGILKGDVEIYLTHGDLQSPARFISVGDRLLLYLAPSLLDGSEGLYANLGCTSSIWLKHATKGELSFLARLGRRANDARIFGEIYPRAVGPTLMRFGGVRVTATDGKRTYSATTAADGTFDIRGLPAGSYRLSADVPGAEDVGTDDDPIDLQPHGCSENDIEVTGLPRGVLKRERGFVFRLNRGEHAG